MERRDSGRDWPLLAGQRPMAKIRSRIRGQRSRCDPIRPVRTVRSRASHRHGSGEYWRPLTPDMVKLHDNWVRQGLSHGGRTMVFV